MNRVDNREKVMAEETLKKKKILHISHTDIRTDSRILKELRALDETGKYVISAIGVDSGDLAREAKITDNVTIESVPLIFTRHKWRPSPIRHGLAFIELFVKVMVRARKHSPDIIHCHDTLALLLGGVLSLFFRTKLVYDAHELESQKNAQSKFASKIVLLIEKLFWARVVLLVSVSPSILKWYDANLGDKSSVLVLNAPILQSSLDSSEVIQSKSRYFHQHFDIPESSVVFIYLGLLVDGRGIQLLLESFSGLGDSAHVVFMGYGELDKVIVAKSERYPNIHYHPAVPHTDVIKLTKSADVGLCFIENVSLSDYYCLPNKLFEYAFSGLPVLASDFPDLKNYVDKYDLGVCSEAKAEVISEQIKAIVGQPLKAINQDLQGLSWQEQASKLVCAYEHTLRSS